MDGIVECYSGQEYPERPMAFNWGGERLEIVEILAQWRAPEGKRFRVRTEEQGIFELVYEEASDQWSIHHL